MIQLQVESVAVEGQQHHGNTVFPFVFQCQDSRASLDAAADWVKGMRSELLESATKHGAVLLRGFPVSSAEDFDVLVRSLDLPNFPYEKSLSNAVRINRTDRVFSANEAPPDV